MDIKTIIKQHTGQYMDEVIRIRRHLHQYPELSFNETETSEYIRGLLDQWNVPYSYPFVKNGILATIEGNGNGSKVIALRSDMDALPVNEESGLEFASVNQGVMHACGHDMHMASLLGAIMVLNGMKQYIDGKVLCVFQPGEEMLPGGAKLMMEEGLFNDNKPDMVIAQHVLPEMEAGSVGFRPGNYMASGDEIFITVKGSGGHAALPENINDPVLMASHILITLQQEINRKSPKGTPTVLSFGKVTANGAVNVIPDEVKLEGTFRTMNESWRQTAHALIAQIATGIAASMGGKIELEIRHGYPVLVNDEGITRKSRALAVEFLGEERVTDMDIRMTAEDFAWFSQSYPSMMYRIGVKSSASNEIYPLHTGRFTADENSLQTGVSMMAWLAINLLKS
ncbi:MAG: M20 family metallopeptidase [Bacteroidales bacterium]